MNESKINVAEIFPRLPLFSELSESQRAVLLESTRVKTVSKGELLFQRGDAPQGFFYVISGQIKLAFSSSAGNEKVVEILGPSQSFGEAVMFMDKPYPVFAEALSEANLLLVKRQAVFDLLESDPTFARSLLAGMSIRLHTLVRDVESYTLRSAVQRVIGYLLQEAGGAPCSAGGQDVVHLPASKQVIASRLNLTPETLSRTFHLLSDEGLIKVDGKDIELLDLKRLADYED
ncbi:MAG: Crp/Fnr family transcriptional regulator [Rhodocyclaceae bacterium]|nr:Crp/Fnr family transcriptional regulator [Rhodocyclaceae bacterium]